MFDIESSKSKEEVYIKLQVRAITFMKKSVNHLKVKKSKAINYTYLLVLSSMLFILF